MFLSEPVTVQASKVVSAVRGEPWQLDQKDHDESLLVELLLKTSRGTRHSDIASVHEGSGLDEERLAKRLDISSDRLAAESFRLWQRTFSEQRDKTAGPDANAQKKGRVSRALQAELQKVVNDGDD